MYPYSRWMGEYYTLSRQWVVTLRLPGGKVVCSYPYAYSREQAVVAATLFYTEKPEVLSTVPYKG